MRLVVAGVVQTIENVNEAELEAAFFEACGVVATVHKDSGEMVSVIVQVETGNLRTLPIGSRTPAMLTLNDLNEGELFLFCGELHALVSKQGNGLGQVKRFTNVAGRWDPDDTEYWTLLQDGINRCSVTIV